MESLAGRGLWPPLVRPRVNILAWIYGAGTQSHFFICPRPSGHSHAFLQIVSGGK